MLWGVFFCCCIAVFTAGLFDAIFEGNLSEWTDDQLKFGNIKLESNLNIFQILLGALVLGVAGGALGAFFINVNTRMAKLRKIILPFEWLKPVETWAWCVLTSSVFFFLTYLTYTNNWCIKNEGELKPEQYNGWCNSGYVDPMASILWASEGGIIRNIMDGRIHTSLP
jgi:H+/Cl- antiporter ClcA